MKGALVRAECLSKAYRGVTALQCASFEAEPGRVTVIAGPSGSGKSTLLRLVGGFEDPDGGNVFFDGIDVTGRPPWERRAVMLSQRPVLLPHLTVRENIMLAAEASGSDPGGETVRLARLLGVEGELDKKPGELSGGQLQRASLAALLASRPRVLLLDEPFAHLDLPLRERLRKLVVSLSRSEGVTVVKVTHDQDEALEVADMLVILVSGRVLDEGPAERVYLKPRDPRAAVFMGHNVVCDDSGVATFPLEAARLGGDWARGVVIDVRRRRGYSLVTVRTGLGLVRVVAPGHPPRPGDRVGVGLEEALVSWWGGEWRPLCSSLPGLVPPGEDVDSEGLGG